MIFEKEEDTITVFQEDVSLNEFLENLKQGYEKSKDYHMIVNLLSFDTLKIDNILEFSELSKGHRELKKSFVLVSDKVSFDEVPEELCVVPTVQEAKDIIAMEEIERDLGV